MSAQNNCMLKPICVCELYEYLEIETTIFFYLEISLVKINRAKSIVCILTVVINDKVILPLFSFLINNHLCALSPVLRGYLYTVPYVAINYQQDFHYRISLFFKLIKNNQLRKEISANLTCSIFSLCLK